MGVMRKIASVSTGGPGDLRSDKERIARNTKKTGKAVQQANRRAPESVLEQLVT